MGPVVTQTLGDNWNQITTKICETNNVWTGWVFCEHMLTCQEDGVDDEVADFTDETVDVVYTLQDAGQDSIELELVEPGADGLNDVLQDAHARLE